MLRRTFWKIQRSREYPPLRGMHNADVAVVGGGMSGLVCALRLSWAGLRVTLVEAEKLGGGISANCAGIVSLTNGFFYSEIEKSRGIDASQRCAATLADAMRAVEDFAKDAGVSWQEIPFWMTGSRERLEREFHAMQRAGISVQGMDTGKSRLAEPWILLEKMAVIHAGEYLEALIAACEKAGVQLFEHSRAVSAEIQGIRTESGTIHAPYVIIATGYPIVDVPGWYFLKMEQYENALLPVEEEGEERIEVHADEGILIRPLSRGRVIWQSGSGAGGIFPKLPDGFCAAEDNVYQSLECRTADGLPYIGSYGKRTPSLFVAAGYAGKGILGSMMAAQAIYLKILGLPSESYEIYSGRRSPFPIHTSLRIGGRYLRSVVRHPTSPRCPHMGCHLVYNQHSRIWECPCHGSRFDDIGHVLNAPAVQDALLQNRRRS